MTKLHVTRRTTVHQSLHIEHDQLVDMVRRAGPTPPRDCTIHVIDDTGSSVGVISDGQSRGGFILHMTWEETHGG